MEELLVENFYDFNNVEDKIKFNTEWCPKFAELLLNKKLRITKVEKTSTSRSSITVLKVFVGNKSHDIIIQTNDTGKFKQIKLVDFKEYGFKDRGDNKHIEGNDEEATIDILNLIASYNEAYHNAALIANGDTRSLQTREEKFEDQVATGKEIAKETPVDVKDWLLNNVTNIKFTLPDLDKIPAAEKRTEKKIKSDLEMLNKLYPGITGTRHFGWENKNPENAVFSFWGLTGFSYFKVPYEDFPQEVKDMVIRAKSISKSKGQWNIENAKPTDKVINNIYFAHAIIDLFDGDYTFCDKISGASQQVVQSQAQQVPGLTPEEVAAGDDVFKQDFDSFNAYGEKVESLREAKEEICCICGEPIEGYGNNPEPYKHEGRCCDACNLKFVIPARLAELNKPEE